jgi:hypothetical protein
MIRHKLTRGVVHLLSLFLLTALVVLAQSNGTVKGILTDQSGKTAAGATVRLVNQGTQQAQETKTGDSGAYAFTFLPPGEYELSTELAGFKRFVRQVRVDIAATVTIDATLELGQATEQVSVVADVQQVETSTSALGRVVEQQLVTALPLSSRNFTQILALSPGVNASVANAGELGRNSVNISANGSRPYDNTVVLNGLLAENPMSQGFDDAPDKAGVPVPSPDALMEFKVQTGLYDAEMGRQGGAVINVVTKSGTNKFHGTLYEFLRNDDLNANEFFRNSTGQPRGTLKQNQFGGTIGGPIKKDKLFFFFSYQGTRQVNGVSASSTRSSFLPAITDDRSAKALGAIFGGKAGVQGGAKVAADGSNINPVALTILNEKLPNGQYVIPTPQTILSNGSGFSTYSIGAPFHEDQYVGDLDYQLNSANHIAVKTFYSADPSTIPFGATPTVPGFGEHDDKVNINDNLIVTTTFSPQVLNELRAGYSRLYIKQTPIEPLTDADIGLSQPVAGWPGIPLIVVTGAFSIGPEQNDNQETMIHNWLASDTLSIVRGRHQIRIGGDVNINQVNRTNAFLTRGRINFGSFPDFLLGMSAAQNGSQFSNLSATQVANGIIRAYPRFKNFSLFAQDDFRINSRLTVNAGVRYQFNGNKQDKNGRIGSFDINLVTPFAVPPAAGTYAGFTVVNNCNCTPPPGFKKLDTNTIVYSENWLAFAPRVGLAYRPIASKDNLVFRAGYGLFWASVAGTVSEQANFDPFYVWNSAGGADINTATFQNPFVNLPPPVTAFPIYTPYTLGNARSTYPTDPYIKPPYTQQWSANFQYSLKSYLFELGYVGSSAVHLLAFQDPNQPFLASPSSPINGITVNTVANRSLRVPIQGWLPTGIQMIKGNLNGHYNGLQFSVTRRFSNGLSFISGYTWSHSIDNDSASAGGRNQPLGGYTGDYYNTRSAIGSSSFDRTHRWVTSYSYTVPAPKWNNAAAAAIVRNWSVSGVTTIQSGLPFSVTDSNNGTIYGISTYAQFAPGKSAADAELSGRTQDRLSQYFNTAAFTSSPVIGDGTGWGNSGRDILRGPGQLNFDAGIGREIKVGGLSEEGKLLFRTEFFNIFNHAQFANPGTNRGASTTYGIVSSTVVAPRIVQFALKYLF